MGLGPAEADDPRGSIDDPEVVRVEPLLVGLAVEALVGPAGLVGVPSERGVVHSEPLGVVVARSVCPAGQGRIDCERVGKWQRTDHLEQPPALGEAEPGKVERSGPLAVDPPHGVVGRALSGDAERSVDLLVRQVGHDEGQRT